MKNWNSSRNQEIKGAFVEREVVACASQLVYELNDSEDFQDNVYEEFYSTPDWELMKDNFIGNLEEDEEKEICEYFNVENITEIDSCTTRLRFKVLDNSKIDDEGLISLGAKAVLKPSENVLHIVIDDPKIIEDILKKLN